MTSVPNSSVFAGDKLIEAQPARQSLVRFILIATVVFNFVLCFVNTKLTAVSGGVVMGVEIALIFAAFYLIYDKGKELYIILFLMSAYIFLIMVVRNEFDPKILRDILIPIVFFFLGRYLGSYQTADRVISLLIAAAVAIALWEWLSLDTYLKYFDVIRYYIARGTVTDADSYNAPGLFVSGFRPTDSRTLGAFLGDHRVSGLFLEPVSVGNFGAIAFAWVLLRRQRLGVLAIQILGLAMILLLSDARFGTYLCAFVLVLYIAAPLIGPAVLFVLPAITVVALFFYGTAHWQDRVDNSIFGRLAYSGDFLSTLDTWQVFGLQTNDKFFGDAGYAYVLVKVGAVGLMLIWTLFVLTPAKNKDALRLKIFIACYMVLVLCISTSPFTIKTAALLWYLYGTTQAFKKEDILSGRNISDNSYAQSRFVQMHERELVAPYNRTHRPLA